MDCFDDIQIEEFSTFDFVDDLNECFLDDGDDYNPKGSKFDLNDYINGNYDY